MQLSWQSVAGATSYNVYRATAAGQLGSLVARISDLTLLDADPDLAKGQTYYYRVSASSSVGQEGLLSAPVSGKAK